MHAGGPGASALIAKMDCQRIRLPDGTSGKVRDFDQFPVVMKKTLCLDTTGDYFLPWLREYVKGKPLDLDRDTGSRQIALGVNSYPFLPIDRPVDWHLSGRLVDAHRKRAEFVGDFFSFVLVPLADKRAEVTIRCHDPDGMNWFQGLLVEIGKRWPEAREATEQRRGGRPGLDHDEKIYRLAKAEEAEKIRGLHPNMYWKEIAQQIGWRYGSRENGLALLRGARHSLHRLQKNDPDCLLQEVEEHRKAKET